MCSTFCSIFILYYALFFSFGHVFVISANALSILGVDFIHSQNVITVFALFVHRWYLLKTVVLVTMYVAVVINVDRMSELSSYGLMRVRK